METRTFIIETTLTSPDDIRKIAELSKSLKVESDIASVCDKFLDVSECTGCRKDNRKSGFRRCVAFSASTKNESAVKNKIETTFEMCPHCECEVELPFRKGVHRCPACGKFITACSICDRNIFGLPSPCSSDCKYEQLAHELNKAHEISGEP